MREWGRVGGAAASIAFAVIALRLLPVGCAPFDSDDDTSDAASTAADAAAETEADVGADAQASCVPAPDFASDAKNCARCGRNCGPAACRNGACEAYVIAEQVPAPWYVEVDAAYAYWTSFKAGADPGIAGDGRVRRAPKLGGGEVTVVANATNSFALIVVDEMLLFTDPGSLGGAFRVAKTGGQVTQIYGNGATELAHVGTNVFLTVDAQDFGHIVAVAPSGATKDVVKFAVGSGPEGIAVDDKDVYWANHLPEGSIARVNVVPGGPPENPWQTGQNQPRRVAVDNEAVYWTNSAADVGGVMRRKKSEDKVTTLVMEDVHYGSIVVDDTHLYATLETGGMVVRVDKTDGGNRMVVANGLVNPTGLAQDGDAIYFTERGGNHRVYRMRK